MEIKDLRDGLEKSRNILEHYEKISEELVSDKRKLKESVKELQDLIKNTQINSSDKFKEGRMTVQLELERAVSAIESVAAGPVPSNKEEQEQAGALVAAALAAIYAAAPPEINVDPKARKNIHLSRGQEVSKATNEQL